MGCFPFFTSKDLEQAKTNRAKSSSSVKIEPIKVSSAVKGSKWEKIASLVVFSGSKERLAVKQTLNPALKLGKKWRQSDFYEAGMVFDIKGGYERSRVDLKAADAWKAMDDQGFVITRDGEKKSVESLNWVFPSLQGAENNLEVCAERGILVWHLEIMADGSYTMDCLTPELSEKVER